MSHEEENDWAPLLLDGLALAACTALIAAALVLSWPALERLRLEVAWIYLRNNLVMVGAFPALYLLVTEVLQRQTAREKLCGLLAWPVVMMISILLLVAVSIPLKLSVGPAYILLWSKLIGSLAVQGIALVIVLNKLSRMAEYQEDAPASSAPASSPEEFPMELQRWNWGALFTAPLWAVSHRSKLGLALFMVPVVNLFAPLIIASRANRWAWQNGMVSDVDAYLVQQKTWAKGGFAFIVLLVGLMLLLA